MIQGLLGVAVARSGEWQGGLSLMGSVEKDPLSFRAFWYEEMSLALLLGDSGLYRSLAITGLARLSSGANGATCGGLAESLLIVPPDQIFLPMITNLVERSKV